MNQLEVLNKNIRLLKIDKEDYICITDIAKTKDNRTDYLISNWMRNRNTIEFLGIWELIHNTDFNPIEFDGIKKESGLNSFILTTKQWIERTNAIGIVSKAGRYGGTYTHKDIAFEFATWISVEFKLYLITEFERLKKIENEKLGWNLHREISKINYRIHTDAIKENIIPIISKSQTSTIYANEADVLNIAVFGYTAKQWRDNNRNLVGNIRDYATIEQLLILSNLESLNEEYIAQGIAQSIRIYKLNESAIRQAKALQNNIKKLGLVKS
ncbi:MAG: KilA-N domain-containing protein [Coprobacillaceae bacterium]